MYIFWTILIAIGFICWILSEILSIETDEDKELRKLVKKELKKALKKSTAYDKK
jgi:hypothetical protein